MEELLLTKSEFPGRYDMKKCTSTTLEALLHLLRSDIGPSCVKWLIKWASSDEHTSCELNLTKLKKQEENILIYSLYNPTPSAALTKKEFIALLEHWHELNKLSVNTIHIKADDKQFFFESI